MADVQIAVIDQQNTEVTIAVPGAQGPVGQTGDVAVAQDGTAAQPGIRFENDTNTGIYRPGADQVAVSTGGTGRLFVDASGNVGVGTVVPGNFDADANNLVIAAAGANVGLTFDADTTASSNIYFADGSTGDNLKKGQISYNHNGDYMAFATNANERARIDSSGRLLVGTSSARSNFFNATVSSALNVEASTDALVEFSGIRNRNNTSGGAILLAKSRGTTAGSNTIVTSGDELGRVSFQGSDGSEFVEAAVIQAEVDGTPNANDMPGRIVLSTTADGASSPTERMRITSDAYVRLAAGTGGIQFNGDTAAANALDDYEEGTWTPNQGSGLTVVGAFSSAGRYTKIGNVVTVWGQVSGSTSIAVSAAGLITTNLPFALQADIGATGTATGFWSTSNSVIHISNGLTTSIYAAQSISGINSMGFTITYRS